MVRAEICAKDVPKLRMAVPTTAPHCDKHLHHDWPEVFSYSITRLFEIQTLQSLKSIWFLRSKIDLTVLVSCHSFYAFQGLNFAYWRLCVSREEIFPNLDFRFYCWEEIFSNLRQFSVWYFTFGTATYKSSDKGFRIFFTFCLCSLSNKSLKSAITTQSYTAYGNTKKWIKFLRIFFFWRKIIFAVFNFRESPDNSRK